MSPAPADFYDAIVIGGGFAGVTTARELAHGGHSVALLEARDRLGGRTWYKDEALPGRALELGGTWVHWLQPHVFAEITRYGLELTESRAAVDPDRLVYMTGGERRDVPYQQAWPMIKEACERFCFDIKELFERPYEPLLDPAVAALDSQSVQDRIDAIDVSPEQRDLLNGIMALACSARCSEGGLITLLRWFALPGWDVELMFDALVRYKLTRGTRALIDAIAADSQVEVVLEAPVGRVAQDEDGVRVTTRSGDELHGATAIVTVPLNTLAGIEFAPALSEAKLAAAAEGQASHGWKAWVQLKGDFEGTLVGIASEDHIVNWIHTEAVLPDGQVLVAFGYDGAQLDLVDRDAVQEAIGELLPDAEVVAVEGHDWLGDEFSRGTWPVLRPGQHTGYLPVLQAPEGRLIFAGSETANGWNGFIDGAIESGLRAAREARQVLRATTPALHATH